MNSRFKPNLNRVYLLPKLDSWPEAFHRFDVRSIGAVQTALAAGRPLLVRGEPGLGKSQLARAVAEVLKVPLVYQVINATCECNDLLYHYDAVSRLAQAQVLQAAGQGKDWETRLDIVRFIRPGVLWWGLDWDSAEKQASEKHYNKVEPPSSPPKWKANEGCVVLIDEIDKADADLANGLLESLGNLAFQVPATGQVVSHPDNCTAPLVIITTNEDRELPPAFVRRCVVLQMDLPKTEAEQIEFLVARGRAHFDGKTNQGIGSAEVYQEAARQLWADRAQAKKLGQPKPGAAEYLDLLRTLADMYGGDGAAQWKALQSSRPFELRDFVFRKHPKPDPE